MKTIRRLSALFLALIMLLGLAACTVSEEDIAGAVQLAADVVSEAAAQEQNAALPEEAPEETAPAEEAELSEPASEPEPEAPVQEEEPAPDDVIDEDGFYTSMEDVALYLHTYGRLPGNFITKNEARALGWSGGGLDGYADGCSIGGDRFGNYEGILPDGEYHECDIDTMHASSRGAKRLVYSDDGRIYYTEDHYESFALLYGEE